MPGYQFSIQIQGDQFSKPLPATEFAALLRHHEVASARPLTQ